MILFIPIVFFPCTCFAVNEQPEIIHSACLCPRISFTQPMLQKTFGSDREVDFSALKNNGFRDNMYPAAQSSKESDYLEKSRQQMVMLVAEADIRSLEDIILSQDALSDTAKDWILLTEAVAARNRIGFSENSYLRDKFQKNLFWCPRNAGRRDLHIHTQFTDGLKDLDAIMQESVSKVIKVIAITDHNTTDGVEKFIEIAAKYGIEVIPGVEFSVLRDFEYVQGNVGVEFHIIGYGVDVEDARLKAALKRVSALFYFKYLSIMYNLFDLDTDFAKASVPEQVKSVYFRAIEDHIALYQKYGMNDKVKKTKDGLSSLTKDDWDKYFALIITVNSEKPADLTEEDIKFIEKFAICNDAQPRAIELVRLRMEQKLIERGIYFKASKYGLWDLENSSLPPLSGAKEIISFIHDAGGVAVFAHPRWYTDIVLPAINVRESEGIDFVALEITNLSEIGLDGLEVQTHWIDKEKDKVWQDIGEQNNLIITGGTDSHFRGKEELGEGMGGRFYLPNANLEQLIKRIITKKLLDKSDQVYVATDDDSLFGTNLSNEIYNLWKNSDVGLNELLSMSRRSLQFSRSLGQFSKYMVLSKRLIGVRGKETSFIDEAI